MNENIRTRRLGACIGHNDFVRFLYAGFLLPLFAVFKQLYFLKCGELSYISCGFIHNRPNRTHAILAEHQHSFYALFKLKDFIES